VQQLIGVLAFKYATKLGYDLTTPLATIHAKNSSNMNPDPWYSTYHFSHPTLKERLEAISALRSKTF
jgi:STE24 endopeptidase